MSLSNPNRGRGWRELEDSLKAGEGQDKLNAMHHYESWWRKEKEGLRVREASTVNQRLKRIEESLVSVVVKLGVASVEGKDAAKRKEEEVKKRKREVEARRAAEKALAKAKAQEEKDRTQRENDLLTIELIVTLLRKISKDAINQENAMSVRCVAPNSTTLRTGSSAGRSLCKGGSKGSIPSAITVVYSEEPSPEESIPTVHTVETQTPIPTRKRKGRQPSTQEPYEIKRRLDQKEATKIATSPPVGTLGSTPAATTTTRQPPAPTPSPPRPSPRHTRKPAEATKKTSTPSPPPTNPSATTSKYGVVIHGIALRKDLGRVRKWLEGGNAELGKTVGIRWLRKKTLLLEEGKKTSSVVVYLEEHTEIDRVRLGGKWLRTSPYEQDRRRK
ncbi:hypothetical protein BDZ91DRAFT_793111 [Kalaharituber pfeilii]|nr:hypothetical protein BDZ91DRAFT_793111 [Kalaharituber pfeilii]